MGLIEKAGRFVPGLNVALELKKSLSPETIKRRMAGVALFGVVASAAGTGVYMSGMNKPDEQHTVTMDGGEATVRAIDRELAELHFVGFQTEVDGVRVENRHTNRKLLGVPIPDITHEVVVNDRLIDSDLCIAGGVKKMTESTIDGVKHIEYVVDPADISVCSRESVDSTAISAEDGNWITNINDASNNLNKMGRNANDHEGNSSLDKMNKLRSAMAQIAKNLALQTVNTQCGPKVFELTKQDALDRIEDTLGREGEVFTAKFPDDLKKIAIDGKSEVDDFFENLPDRQIENQIVSYEVKAAGECKISPDATPTTTASSQADQVAGDN